MNLKNAQVTTAALKNIWPVVDNLSGEDAETILSSFIAGRVEDDFARKFRQDFNGSKDITGRFFRTHYKYLAVNDDIVFELGIGKETEVTAMFVCNGVNESIGWSVAGLASQLNPSLILTREDTVIEVIWRQHKQANLFISGHTEAVYCFTNS